MDIQKNWPDVEGAFYKASWIWTTQEWNNIIEDLPGGCTIPKY
jgi:hypothetical protein